MLIQHLPISARKSGVRGWQLRAELNAGRKVREKEPRGALNVFFSLFFLCTDLTHVSFQPARGLFLVGSVVGFPLNHQNILF